MGTILIKNGIIITLDESYPVLHDYSVLIEDGKIKSIKPKEEFKDRYDKETDADGKVIMPGFINAHMHFYSTLVRGLANIKPSNNFVEVLKNLWWKLDRILTLENCYYSAIIMLLNGIRHGTTTFIDHHASPKSVRGSLMSIAKAVNESGLRACLCYEVSDRDGQKITDEGIMENAEFIKYCRDNKSDFLKALFGLHAAFTLSDETLEKASQTGKELNTGFHIHTAESESDQKFNYEKYKMRVVNRLHKFGILGQDSIAVHCVHINDEEMDILSETKTPVVHNPQSNMNNAVGIADIIKMSEKGILVGLGTDAMTVNMTEELRVALWAQHLRSGNPSAGFTEVTSTLLKNNSKIAGRIWNLPLGVIKEGSPADIIIIDYLPPTPIDENSYSGHIVFGISQSQVDTTIVNGKILMENKKLRLDVDENEIYAKAREQTKILWKKF